MGMAQEYESKTKQGIRFVQEWQVQNLSDRQTGALGLPKILATSATEAGAIDAMRNLTIPLQKGWQLAIVPVYVVT